MVRKIKIVFTPHVIDFLDDLVRLLYKKEYFSYEENAKRYVDKIVGFIILEINSLPHKPTLQKLRYLG
ncbi:hypothetical protein [Flavobacterium psychrolimnae]|uniref:Type II toxin-antitoxin system RelE/ParE family toxin n=1 Tax=Flavobacterium psychrolimnae TaxID=249351 RepID=A0A366AZS6_9FLAO|nr:hypothetical protein [Flavobacterium psychrolimnae]RBN50369.1 hypothetical protein DR980_07695 [Flavobacterium psychrolimnae]